MTTHSPPLVREFDGNAADEFKRLINAGRLDGAAELLGACAAREDHQGADLALAHADISSMRGDYGVAIQRLLRALRLTSRHRERRPFIRLRLAEILLRVGNMDRAEKLARRSLAEIHATGRGREVEPWVLNDLGLIHRRRGTLTFAVQMYEQALALVEERDPPSEIFNAVRMNLALALTHRGDLERAGEILRELRAMREPALPAWRRANLHLSFALYALHVGDLEACEAAIARSEEYSNGGGVRLTMISREYRAELLMARGRAAEAVPLLDRVLGEAVATAPLGDMVPEAARRLATALFETRRYDEALERAQIAIRTGRHADALEWAAGLRVAGQCLAALGRSEQARARFAEARAVLQSTEFVAERRRLEAAVQRFGGNGTELRPAARSARPRGQIPAAARRVAPVRLTLRDGRAFVTRDAELVARIRLAATSRIPVLIEGETGTGKELVAHLIHELGPTADKPFVVVDCATLLESLAEAELFGAARGAYTGSIADRRGLIAAADGGTLLLDELPELSLTMQAKLLRVLQEGTYRRVGEDRLRRISARVMASTNRDAERLVANGRLKSDLFYRLNGHRLKLLPLRDRPQDVPDIALELAHAEGLGGIAESALERLALLAWPGNVRQLEMMIRVAATRLPAGAWLDESALEERLGEAGPHDPLTSLRAERLEAERQALKRVLERHNGNIAAAARSLSMSRQGLYKALQRTGLIAPPSTAG